jgi:hypothetical protein
MFYTRADNGYNRDTREWSTHTRHKGNNEQRETPLSLSYLRPIILVGTMRETEHQRSQCVFVSSSDQYTVNTASCDKYAAVRSRFIKATPPSFFAFLNLENCKHDFVQTFTMDRASKITGPLFEEIFFFHIFHPGFFQKRFFRRVHRDKGKCPSIWSDRAEFFTTAAHDPSPEVLFSVFQNLPSFGFYRENSEKFFRRLNFLDEKPYKNRRRGDFEKLRKEPLEKGHEQLW